MYIQSIGHNRKNIAKKWTKYQIFIKIGMKIEMTLNLISMTLKYVQSNTSLKDH